MNCLEKSKFLVFMLDTAHVWKISQKIGVNKDLNLTHTSNEKFHNWSIPKKEISMLIKSFWAFPVLLSAYFFNHFFAKSFTLFKFRQLYEITEI